MISLLRPILSSPLLAPPPQPEAEETPTSTVNPDTAAPGPYEESAAPAPQTPANAEPATSNPLAPLATASNPAVNSAASSGAPRQDSAALRSLRPESQSMAALASFEQHQEAPETDLTEAEARAMALKAQETFKQFAIVDALREASTPAKETADSDEAAPAPPVSLRV